MEEEIYDIVPETLLLFIKEYGIINWKIEIKNIFMYL